MITVEQINETRFKLLSLPDLSPEFIYKQIMSDVFTIEQLCDTAAYYESVNDFKSGEVIRDAVKYYISTGVINEANNKYILETVSSLLRDGTISTGEVKALLPKLEAIEKFELCSVFRDAINAAPNK
jgi:hypothetical protein